MRKALPQLARLRLAKDHMHPEVRLEIGVIEHEGKAWVGLKVGNAQMRLTPERAEEIAVDLRNFALEVRNGGALT